MIQSSDFKGRNMIVGERARSCGSRRRRHDGHCGRAQPDAPVRCFFSLHEDEVRERAVRREEVNE